MWFSVILHYMLITGFCAVVSDASANKTIWYEDWDKGMEAAMQDNKPVIVDFVAPACPGCNKLNEETLSAPEITKRFNKDWVCIRIHILYKNKYSTYDGKTMSYYEIPKHFGVKGLPTLLFFDKNGKYVYSLAGYIDKKRFGLILDCMKNEEYERSKELINTRRYGLNQLFSSIPFLIMVSCVMVLFVAIFKFEKKYKKV